MSQAVQVLKPRSHMDRTMARLEHMKVWENVTGAVDRQLARIARLEQIAKDEKATRSTRIRADVAAARIDRETFLDRTLPVVKHVDHTAVMAMLPMAADESTQSPVTDEEKARAEAIALLRGLIAQLTSAAAPVSNGARPGLVLLREGDRAAG